MPAVTASDQTSSAGDNWIGDNMSAGADSSCISGINCKLDLDQLVYVITAVSPTKYLPALNTGGITGL